MNKFFTFGPATADLNAFERNLNANGEVCIGTDDRFFDRRNEV